MGKTIGNLHWRACSDCNYMDKAQGGCSENVPDDFYHMTLNGDYIECDLYIKMG